MNDNYSPNLDFLCMIANGEVPLTDNAMADDNLRLLISLTRDADVSNRDWATMLLAQQEIDTPEVRQALLVAAEDADVDVRAEAIQGLAARDSALVLPLVERELLKDECGFGVFEAAILIAHPSLVPGLQIWKERFSESYRNDLVNHAIAACDGSLPSPV